MSEYCDNDVVSTERVFEHLHEDWVARQVLAKVARALHRITRLTP